MARGTAAAVKNFHTPMLLDWTDDKLKLLDQEQLLNLLANLDHQRAIGRVNETTALALEQRITALLTKRNVTKRRAELSKSATE